MCQILCENVPNILLKHKLNIWHDGIIGTVKQKPLFVRCWAPLAIYCLVRIIGTLTDLAFQVLQIFGTTFPYLEYLHGNARKLFLMHMLVFI